MDVAELVVAVGADLKEVKTKLNELSGHIKKVDKDTSGLGKSFDSVKNHIIAAFSIDALVNFGKSIIETTAEFEKFEAVLTNTLGSKSAAFRAMSQIQEFAAQTPFGVAELTDSFVKLANQGFVPTTNELRKMGDLAASTGKSFNQLTEAIIDAQTGEFERLKEFGIRAQKEGDKVTFTFKDVKKQVDFTNESIRDYVLSLGDLTGVSGSMAAISDTLGGKISNLGDAWDKFTNALGSSTGVLKSTVGFLADLVDGVSDLIIGIEGVLKRENADNAQRFFEEQKKGFLDIAEAAKASGTDVEGAIQSSYDKQLALLQTYLSQAKAELEKYSDENNIGVLGGLYDTNEQEEGYKQRLQTVVEFESYIEALRDAQAKATAELAKSAEATKEYLGLIEQEENKLKDLEEARKNAGTHQEVLELTSLIEKQQEYLKNLKETTVEQYKLSKMELPDISPKGFDTKTLFTPDKNAQLAYSIELETIKQVSAELGIAAQKSQLFGDSFGYVSEKSAILTQALNYLVENGVNLNSFAIANLKAQLDELQVKIGDVSVDLTGFFTSTLTSFAESLGQMAGGVGQFENFLDGLILLVIDFASQFGKLLIAAGLASEAFQKSLTTNPYVAIAAGVALVGAAAAAKAFLSKNNFGGGGATPMANGGLVYGPSYILAGEYSGARNNPEVIAPLNKLIDYMPDGGGGWDGRVEFEIEGTKLKGVLDKTEARNKRTF